MKAFITGVNGQVGSYMADFLLARGYEVFGLRRRSASGSLWRLKSALKQANFKLVEGDITDFSSCYSLLAEIRPDEIYNFAAQSHVKTSFEQPSYTFQVNTGGVLNLLECIRLIGFNTKFYQSSTSEMFGTNKTYDFDSDTYFQYEHTSFMPQSPYSISKLAAHELVSLYRKAYGLWCVAGLMFNTESPRRSINFVTRKITSHFCNKDISHTKNKIKLGNLHAVRDWNYTPEAVEAIYLMVQQKLPRNFVIGTGESHTVQEFLEEVISLTCPGYSINEVAEIDESLFRPCEVPYLKADPSSINRELGWKSKIGFKELVKIMVDNENGET